jgi:hypothetical protein
MFKWIFILSLSNNRDTIGGGDEKVLGVVGGWGDVVVGGALDGMMVVVSVESLKGNL